MRSRPRNVWRASSANCVGRSSGGGPRSSTRSSSICRSKMSSWRRACWTRRRRRRDAHLRGKVLPRAACRNATAAIFRNTCPGSNGSSNPKAFRTLNILDEFSRECLTIRVKCRLNSTDVIDALTDLFILRGPPAFVRSDNGPEFVAKDVRAWIEAVGAKTAFIEPGSPWENGYVESFNARFRDELLNREIFYSLREAQIIIEGWRKHYNTKRPHSALGYRPPAPEAIVAMEDRPIMH